MKVAQFAVRHIKAVVFATVALCLIGIWTLTSFPVAILPDITFPRVKVIADAGDLPVRNVDIAVTRPVEQAIAVVPGVQRIRSRTQRGGTEISVDFAWGTDMLMAQQLVNTRINEVRSQLPPDTNVSAERMNPTLFPILGLSLRVKGMSPSDVWSLANYTLRPRLARVPGVARVVVQGGRVPEIAVDVDPRRMAAYRLSLQDVGQALTQTNTLRAVGRMDRQYQQYEAIVSGVTTDPQQLGAIVVASRGGVPITLHQLADIHPSVEDPTTVVTADGSEAVLINIVRQPEANTVAVTDAVKAEIAAMRPSLPAGTSIGVWYDQSYLVREAVGSVEEAVLIGAVLAVFVLLLFLGNLRATIVTAAIIPATLLITFLFMRLAGMSLNLMTLGALAVGIGLMIDDAIVVVENVFRHLSHGRTREESVQEASREIAAPMVSSTLTTVVVFLPLVLLGGVAGAFFTALAITLAIALMVSLALALVVSPSLCAAFLRTRDSRRPVQSGGAASDDPHTDYGPAFARFVGLYERLLRLCIRQRWIMPVVAAGAVALTLWFGTHLQTGFMPEMDEGAFTLDYLTPPGTSLAESDRLLRQIEKVLSDTPDVEAYSRRTGTELGFAVTESNSGDFAVLLKHGRRRPIDEVIDDVRTEIKKTVPGVDIDFSQMLQDLIGDLSGAPSPIEVKLFGENQQALNDTATSLADKLGKVKGLADVKSGVIEAGPQLVVQIDPLRAGRAGLTPSAVADQANAAMFGDVVTQMVQGDRQVPVRVRYPQEYRSDKQQLAMLPIRSPNGFNLPLAALGNIETVPGTTEIDREDQRRFDGVSARLDNVDLGTAVRNVRRVMRDFRLPAGVTWVMGGQAVSQADTFRNLLVVLGLAIVLVFTVMLFQFGSFTAPMVILLVMPLSLFGVTLGLWITNKPWNVSSFMGAVMLVGIVVKNGILLLDMAQQAEIAGSTPEEAVVHAARIRLRPILMTTLTALLGLLPLAFGIGAGAQMQQPLAIAVIGGLSFSTVFTLLFAPLLYLLLKRLALRHGAAVPARPVPAQPAD